MRQLERRLYLGAGLEEAPPPHRPRPLAAQGTQPCGNHSPSLVCAPAPRELNTRLFTLPRPSCAHAPCGFPGCRAFSCLVTVGVRESSVVPPLLATSVSGLQRQFDTRSASRGPRLPRGPWLAAEAGGRSRGRSACPPSAPQGGHSDKNGEMGVAGPEPEAMRRASGAVVGAA